MGVMRSTLCLSLTLLTGCSSSRPLLVQPHPDPETDTKARTLGAERQRITGYVLKSGERLSFDGYVEIRGDTLHFERPRIESRGLENPKPLIVRDIPRDSVVAVAGAYTNVPNTILMSVGIAGLIVLFMGLSFAANFQPLGAFGGAFAR